MIPRIENVLRLMVPLVLFGSMMLMFTSGCAPGPTETREDSFTVAGYCRVVVSSENGSIEVNAGAGNEVIVQATLRDAPRVKYELSQVGETITVDAKMIRRWWSLSTGGTDIRLTVPQSTDVELRTSNGDIELRGIAGTGTFATSNGDIVMDSVKGDFDGTTSNGRIEVNAVEGRLMLRTSNGKVNLHEAMGEFDVETSNGGISYSGSMTAGGTNRLVTSNGSVVVQFRGDPSVVLDAETSNGDVICELPIQATVVKDERLVGKIGGGEADLYIRTSNGDVTIK